MRLLGLAVIGCSVLAAGCRGPGRVAMFTPMSEAVAIVEANRRSIPTGLRAYGSVRGHFLDAAGVRRHYDLEAKLLVLPPDSLRFVMEHMLAGDELRVGMNDEKWWVWVRRPEARQVEGRRGREGVSVDGNLPVGPEQLMEALGLSVLGATEAAQRVTADYQQLIFMAAGEGHRTIEKEYWLDRYEPRLIRRILFRDGEGRIALSSELDRYAPVGDGGGALMPHVLRLSWPEKDAEMVFRINRWREDASLTPDHPAFVAPSDREAWFD